MKNFFAAGRAEGGTGRYVATLVLAAAAYFVLAKLGLRLASINPSASPIWPPTGFALAIVLLGGLRLWPAVFAGALAANATTAGTLATATVIAAGALVVTPVPVLWARSPVGNLERAIESIRAGR